MTFLDLLDRIPVHLGPSTYAEPFDPETFLKMPVNALVNVGYFLVALIWVREVRRWGPEDPRRPAGPLFIAFALMGAAYAPIQFWRIVTQSHLAAVMDQWTTLPFFGFLGAWNLMRRPGGERWRRWFPFILAASAFSYVLAVLIPHGFVVALGLHMAFAIATSVEALKLDGGASRTPFFLALACCAGFVVLKEADFALAQVSLFQRFTGHFWSKVCDFLQIHFALRFVAAGYVARAQRFDARAPASGWSQAA